MKSNFIFGDMTFFENFKKPFTTNLKKPCNPTFGFRVKNAPFSGGGGHFVRGGYFSKVLKTRFWCDFCRVGGVGFRWSWVGLQRVKK